MIGLEDRQALARDIHIAHAAGARLKLACETAGIDLRTLQRWQAADGLVSGDRRPQAVRPIPRHALSEAERTQVLAVANAPRFAAVPPARIWRACLRRTMCASISAWDCVDNCRSTRWNARSEVYRERNRAALRPHSMT